MKELMNITQVSERTPFHDGDDDGGGGGGGDGNVHLDPMTASRSQNTVTVHIY